MTGNGGNKILSDSLEDAFGTDACLSFSNCSHFASTSSSSKTKKIFPGFAPGRKYSRYRGPYLDQLTFESLKAEPRKWGEFFGFEWRRSGARRKSTKETTNDGDDDDSDKPSSSLPSSSSGPSSPPSYTLPTSVLALRERSEENIVAFLPNYLRALAALVVSLAAFGGRPLSLVGLACLACFAFAHARGLLGGPSIAETIAKQQQLVLEQQQRAAALTAGQVPPPPPVSPSRTTAAEGVLTTPARAAATILAYGVAAYTRAFAPLTRGIALGMVLTALHACLRVAATERAAWSSASEQARKSSYLVAGVPFRDVTLGASEGRGGASGGAASASAASAQLNHRKQEAEDPRRCLRELAAAARALASAASIGAKAGAAAAVDAAVAKVKALRQQLR